MTAVRTVLKKLLMFFWNAPTEAVAPFRLYASTVTSKLSAVHGARAGLFTVIVGCATVGSDKVEPGVMKLTSGRPIVRAYAARRRMFSVTS